MSNFLNDDLAANPASHALLEKVHVLDGGLATELEAHGISVDGPLWSARALADAPEAIERVHLQYLRAGAQCILTASYQVSAMGYAEAEQLGAEAALSRAGWALRRSLALARAAVEQHQQESPGAAPVLVAVSLGPYGAALHNGAEFHGNYAVGADQLRRFHRERVAALPDEELLAFETVPSLAEAEAIAEVLSEFPRRRAWVSFTCRDAEHVAHGEPLRRCAERLDRSPQVVAVGVNCTDPALALSLLAAARRGTGKPLLVYPNSGERWDAAGRCWVGESSVADYGRLAEEWFRAGAHAVGGCCRTGPAHIRAVAQAAATYFAEKE